MTNPVCIIGTVATEPRLVPTGSGVPLCSFRIASNDRRYDREQNKWVDGETNWMTVTAFRSLATHAQHSLRKGDRVIVNGRLRVRRWEQIAKERSGLSVEVDADALGHDLRWGTTRFTKQVGGAAGADDAGSTGKNADEAPDGDSGGGDAEHSEDGFVPDAA